MRYLFRWVLVGAAFACVAAVAHHGFTASSVKLGLAVALVGTIAAWLYRWTWPARNRRWQAKYAKGERQMIATLLSARGRT
jgi:hypothetical protein